MPVDEIEQLPKDAVLDRLLEADKLLDEPTKLRSQADNTMVAMSYGLLGAIDWLNDAEVVLSYLRKALPDNFGADVPDEDDYEVIHWFNDDPTTTFDDIKGVLKRAIELRKQDL